jgi:hypothetical protein
MIPTESTTYPQPENGKDSGAQTGKASYPLFLIACFCYFYYDDILIKMKAGRI